MNLDRLSKGIHEDLKMLMDKFGAYAVRGWRYESKITFQCDHKKLVKWLEDEGLEFNSMVLDNKAYEGEFFIAFTDSNC